MSGTDSSSISQATPILKPLIRVKIPTKIDATGPSETSNQAAVLGQDFPTNTGGPIASKKYPLKYRTSETSSSDASSLKTFIKTNSQDRQIAVSTSKNNAGAQPLMKPKIQIQAHKMMGQQHNSKNPSSGDSKDFTTPQIKVCIPGGAPQNTTAMTTNNQGEPVDPKESHFGNKLLELSEQKRTTSEGTLSDMQLDLDAITKDYYVQHDISFEDSDSELGGMGQGGADYGLAADESSNSFLLKSHQIYQQEDKSGSKLEDDDPDADILEDILNNQQRDENDGDGNSINSGDKDDLEMILHQSADESELDELDKLIEGRQDLDDTNPLASDDHFGLLSGDKSRQMGGSIQSAEPALLSRHQQQNQQTLPPGGVHKTTTSNNNVNVLRQTTSMSVWGSQIAGRTDSSTGGGQLTGSNHDTTNKGAVAHHQQSLRSQSNPFSDQLKLQKKSVSFLLNTNPSNITGTQDEGGGAGGLDRQSDQQYNLGAGQIQKQNGEEGKNNQDLTLQNLPNENKSRKLHKHFTFQSSGQSLLERQSSKAQSETSGSSKKVSVNISLKNMPAYKPPTFEPDSQKSQSIKEIEALQMLQTQQEDSQASTQALESRVVALEYENRDLRHTVANLSKKMDEVLNMVHSIQSFQSYQNQQQAPFLTLGSQHSQLGPNNHSQHSQQAYFGAPPAYGRSYSISHNSTQPTLSKTESLRGNTATTRQLCSVVEEASSEHSTISADFGKSSLKDPKLIKYKSQMPIDSIHHQRSAVVGSNFSHGQPLAHMHTLNSNLRNKAPPHHQMSQMTSLIKQGSQLTATQQQNINTTHHSVSAGRSTLHEFGKPRPDIIFAYANVFGRLDDHENFIPFMDRQIISSNTMFSRIKETSEKANKNLRIEMRTLTYLSFASILDEKPRVLFILCHGDIKKVKGKITDTYLCFEAENCPGALDEYNIDRLVSQLNQKSLDIDVVVLSACHSERFGEILLKAGVGAVIAINSQDQVLEKASMDFNKIFLEQLIQGRSIKESFTYAKGTVGAMPRHDSKSCCCMHPHRPGCLFEIYLQRQGMNIEYACRKLHKDSCDCFQQFSSKNNEEEDKPPDELLTLAHRYDCEDYKHFFRELVYDRNDSMVNHTDKVLKRLDSSKKTNKYYLKMPVETYSRGEWNIKCCCSSDRAHTETDKFRYLNKDDDENLKKCDIFNKPRPGKPRVKEPDFSKLNGFSDARQNYFLHKKEVFRIVNFLSQKGMDRLLVVHGPFGVGKLMTLIKSIRFGVEHQFESLKDGAHVLDLQSIKKISELFEEIKATLQLSMEEKPSQKDIESASYLKQISKVLIFHNVPTKDLALFKQITDFAEQMTYKTEKLRIVLVTKLEDMNSESAYEWFTNKLRNPKDYTFVEIRRMDRLEALQFLGRVFEVERKLEFVKKDNLERHKIIDEWEKINFVDDEAFNIARKLSHTRSLTDIANDMERISLVQNNGKYAINSSASSNTVSIDSQIALLATTIMYQLKDSGAVLLMDLVLFMTLCPAGLCLTEAQLLASSITLYWDTDKKRQELNTYTKIFDSIKRNVCEIDESSEKKASRELVTRLFMFSTIDELEQEIRLKFQLQQHQIFDFVLKSGIHIELEISEMDRFRLFKTAVEFFHPYAIFLLYRIRDAKRNGDLDHHLMSASLGYGMWQFGQGVDFGQFSSKFYRYEARFQVNAANFVNLLEKDVLIKLEILFRLQEEQERETLEKIRQLAIVVPSIYAELESYDEAIQAIKKARKLFDFEQKSKFLATLDLIEASICQKIPSENFKILAKEKRHSAHEIFRELKFDEGIGECYFLGAVMVKGQRESGGTFQLDSNSFSQNVVNSRAAAGPARRQSTRRFANPANQNSAITNRESTSTNNNATYLSPESNFDDFTVTDRRDRRDSTDTLDTDLLVTKKPIELFQSAYSHFCKIKAESKGMGMGTGIPGRLGGNSSGVGGGEGNEFHHAKCLYEISSMLLHELQGSDLESGFMSNANEVRQDFEGNISLALDYIKRFADGCALNQSNISTQDLTMQKFKARCFMMQAKCGLLFKDLSYALECVKKAEMIAKQSSFRLMSRKSVTIDALSHQSSEMRLVSSKSVMSGTTTSNNTGGFQEDSALMLAIKNLNQKIIEKMWQVSTNLFTFAKATPIIKQDESGQICAVNDAVRTSFDFRNQLKTALKETGMEFQVKFEILSLQFLRRILKFGSRLLHLTSDISEENCIILEGENGLSQPLPLPELKLEIKKVCGEHIPVDVVSIAIPQSLKIGQTFSELGLKHVLCFDYTKTVQFEDADQREDSFMRYQFNYIYCFVAKFYEHLAKELPIWEAFEQAKLEISTEEVFEYKFLQLQLEDLNVIPVLLEPEHKRHNERLFDSNIRSNDSDLQKLKLLPGSVIDTSKIRGHLTGVKRATTPYIGRKVELHEAISALADQENPVPLINVYGVKHAGKSRFVQEICYFFYSHNRFRSNIYLTDLSKHNEDSHYVKLIDLLNGHLKDLKKEKIQAEEENLTDEEEINSDSNSEDDQFFNRTRKEVQRGAQTSAQKQKQNSARQELLWAFTNADKIDPKRWKKFSSYLRDRYQTTPGLRIIISQTKKLHFDGFLSENDIKREAEEQQRLRSQRSSNAGSIGGGSQFGRMSSGFSAQRTIEIEIQDMKRRTPKRKDINLRPLHDFESADIILQHCERQISANDFGVSTLQKSVRNMLSNEQIIRDCKGLPKYLIDVAEQISNGISLMDIRVISNQREDRLQGTPAHHKSRRNDSDQLYVTTVHQMETMKGKGGALSSKANKQAKKNQQKSAKKDEKQTQKKVKMRQNSDFTPFSATLRSPENLSQADQSSNQQQQAGSKQRKNQSSTLVAHNNSINTVASASSSSMIGPQSLKWQQDFKPGKKAAWRHQHFQGISGSQLIAEESPDISEEHSRRRLSSNVPIDDLSDDDGYTSEEIRFIYTGQDRNESGSKQTQQDSLWKTDDQSIVRSTTNYRGNSNFNIETEGQGDEVSDFTNVQEQWISQMASQNTSMTHLFQTQYTQSARKRKNGQEDHLGKNLQTEKDYNKDEEEQSRRYFVMDDTRTLGQRSVSRLDTSERLKMNSPNRGDDEIKENDNLLAGTNNRSDHSEVDAFLFDEQDTEYKNPSSSKSKGVFGNISGTFNDTEAGSERSENKDGLIYVNRSNSVYSVKTTTNQLTSSLEKDKTGASLISQHSAEKRLERLQLPPQSSYTYSSKAEKEQESPPQVSYPSVQKSSNNSISSQSELASSQQSGVIVKNSLKFEKCHSVVDLPQSKHKSSSFGSFDLHHSSVIDDDDNDDNLLQQANTPQSPLNQQFWQKQYHQSQKEGKDFTPQYPTPNPTRQSKKEAQYQQYQQLYGKGASSQQQQHNSHNQKGGKHQNKGKRRGKGGSGSQGGSVAPNNQQAASLGKIPEDETENDYQDDYSRKRPLKNNANNNRHYSAPQQ